MENHDLETPWILWNHGIEDKSWENSSYKNIYSINNLYDYKSYKDVLNTEHLQNSMFFLMRKDIFPTWEDPDNRDGCCASFKIPLKDIKDTWLTLIQNIISENIHTKLDNYLNINGLSIAPKKEFNIIKIWFRNNIKDLSKNINFCNKYILTDNCKIKKN